MILKVPKLSLVVLVGASGCGKSTFARTHFLPTEIVSSDTCRGLVDDDASSQDATSDAFELLHFTIAKRLQRGKLTVVDATNVQAAGRRQLVELARKYHVLLCAIVFDISEEICHARNKDRPDRQFGPHVVRNQSRDLRQSLRTLRKEGFRQTYVLKSVDDVTGASIQRDKLWNDKTDVHGPFDIIGDVHGCYQELVQLLQKLGYDCDPQACLATPPPGRTAIFLGDLIDRGPDSVSVLKLVMAMVQAGHALAVPGNHDTKLVKYLDGNDVTLNHGLNLTVSQLSRETPEFQADVRKFLDGLISHYVLDDGKLVVAHAGLPEAMQGRGSGAVRQFALYGETTGEVDEFGLPVRYQWATDYRGRALVAYGHTPVVEVAHLNHTVCLDTGCVFGGKLSAMRYPENEFVDVPSQKVYCEPSRPLVSADTLSSQHQADESIDIAPFRQRMHIKTNLGGTIIVPEENCFAALEIISRYASNPKWLVYLPPTMSPGETSALPNYLEHPNEVLSYFRNQEVSHLIAEEKHMGSRAVAVFCRNEDVAASRFGVIGEGIGVIFTRTGRPFFPEKQFEQAMLFRVATAMEKSGLWDELQSDWVVLDCELLPWSAKARELLRTQFAPVGAAGQAGIGAALAIIQQAQAITEPDSGLSELQARLGERKVNVEKLVAAYRPYCWPAQELEDFKLAPFHILASEGNVHMNQDHIWHMEHIHRLAAADPKILRATNWQEVELSDEASCQKLVEWWVDFTQRGGEGLVLKPRAFTVNGDKGLVQPSLKCRGTEYLRIVYGPDYLMPQNLVRLKKRNVGAKRRLASREYALGMEALHRFVQRQPIRDVHECVFGVLAFESEPVDPRL